MFIALTGKPSVGKSCFFKAATLVEVEIHERPFTTLKSSEGIAYVKVDCVDKEFNVQCTPREGYCINGKRFVPVKLMDIPGLIEGSHVGRGRGNQFLGDIAQADVLIHIIDISGSTNEKGEPVLPLSHDPLKDVKFLEKEIDLWFLSIVKKGWDKFAKTVRGENQNIKQAIAKQLSGLKVTEEIAEEAIKELKLIHHPIEWTESDLEELSSVLRRKTKPMLIAANKIDVEGAEYNFHRLKKAFPDILSIPCSAESELALKEAAKQKLIEYIPGEREFTILQENKLNEKQKKGLEFIKKNVLEKYGSTGMQEVLDKTVFDFLRYIAVFPVGNSKLEDSKGRCLPDCYLIKKGRTALDLAYKIHQDIGNNFIKAIDIKRKIVIGKDYQIKHMEVIEIKTKYQ